ncbi:MAG: DNA primase, partial [Rhodospirillaceae bacterium]
LKSAVSLSDVVRRRVKLIRGGPGEFKGLCPFHNEKTPSFTVSDTKGFFHCFGCGAHGDVIAFEMRASNVPFLDAVERLAAQAGMVMPQTDPKEAERSYRRAGLRDVVEMATQFYVSRLNSPEGREAMEYLLTRGLTYPTVDRFRLGYAPAGSALRAHFSRDRIPLETAVEAGCLSSAEDGRIYDFMRDRIVIPITDRQDRPIGFGGRTLGDAEPKYLNSRDGTLFNKGGLLFNLARAREPARQQGALFVVEGYMDVIALAEVGIDNAVAPLGTAMTEAQFRLAWQAADRVILCFDGDRAGREAAERALRRGLPLLTHQRTLDVCLLPDGQDPADIVLGNTRWGGSMEWEIATSKTCSALDHVWSIASSRLLLGTKMPPNEWAKAERAVTEWSDLVGDEVLRKYWRRELGRRLDGYYQAMNLPAVMPVARYGSLKGARCARFRR